MTVQSSKSIRREFGLLFLVLGAIAAALGCILAIGFLTGAESLPPADVFYPSNEYLDAVRTRVAVGDPLEPAIEALSDAWYHTECRWGEDRLDLFFYGPEDGGVTVIGLRSAEADGELVVEELGIVDTSALLQLEECLPPGFLE